MRVVLLCKCSWWNSKYVNFLIHVSFYSPFTSLQDSYIQQRSHAIESIETTIAELGQIFTQLANMVAEQRETVQRIDDNVVDIESNINSAHGELSKYLAGMMSNRWLMLKMFGVIIVFVRSPAFSPFPRCLTCVL